MNGSQLYDIEVFFNGELVEFNGFERALANGVVKVLEAALAEVGFEQDEWTGDWERGGDSVDILVLKEFDEDDPDCFPGGEIGRVLAADSAAEYAKIVQQEIEDAAWERRFAVTYQGVLGSLEPDGGYIFEP